MSGLCTHTHRNCVCMYSTDKFIQTSNVKLLKGFQKVSAAFMVKSKCQIRKHQLEIFSVFNSDMAEKRLPIKLHSFPFFSTVTQMTDLSKMTQKLLEPSIHLICQNCDICQSKMTAVKILVKNENRTHHSSHIFPTHSLPFLML